MEIFRAAPKPTGFEEMYTRLARHILDQPLRDTGRWQSQDAPQARQTREAAVTIEYPIPTAVQRLQDEVMPNLPWAEDHFLERVSGIPWNPPPSSHYWPYEQSDNDAFRDEQGKFSHTYPERFWPRPQMGIRYTFGNLASVVKLLERLPQTRQAYLPIWFPEDTGAKRDQRVPCSLGYQFLLRDDHLHCFYFMRSCDLVRHFADDVYLAGRLTQWICDRVNALPGLLTMTVTAMHTFRADDFVLGKALK